MTPDEIIDGLVSAQKGEIASPEEAYAFLAELVKAYMPHKNLEIVRKAFEYASAKHGAQTRKSGIPYVCHPVAVATILAELRVDLASLVAALLHDVVEDTDATLEDVEAGFGKAVAELVDGLTKLSKIQFRSSQEKLAENFRKMLLAMAKDLRVILIKLADRLHNMRTLKALSPERRDKIAQETIEIYAPLANRLGIYGIKNELEDLCLKQLKNDVFKEIRARVSGKRDERQQYIDDVRRDIEAELGRYGLKNAEVSGRPKHFYSIYKKMIDRQLEFDDIHDLFGFRIIVESVKDCYEALGIVHAMWKPMPGRFKDYIAMPKANMYQSLHTTVIRPDGEPVEIQIRTREMHQICEFGVAAHWAYKEKKTPGGSDDMQKFSWLRQMVAFESELKDPDEFLEAVKVDLFQEEIFVFTPRGDVVELAAGSTALDFAYAVHTNVGQRCIGAKVNGRLVPIKKTLASGDIVEILTSPNQKPSKDWLSFVTTSRARSKIRSYLRSEQRERGRILGKELLERELDGRGLAFDALVKSGEIQKLIKAGKFSSTDEMLIDIGYGRTDPKEYVDRVFPVKEPEKTLAQTVSDMGREAPVEKTAPKARASKSGIMVSGIEDVLVTMARCCNPLPGEDVVGYVTRGKGVTVHRSGCSRAIDLDPARRIDVQWATEGQETLHTAFISVVAHDRPGVLADITGAIANAGANILKAQIRVAGDMKGVMDFEISVKGLAQLKSLMHKIEMLTSILSVDRRDTMKLK